MNPERTRNSLDRARLGASFMYAKAWPCSLEIAREDRNSFIFWFLGPAEMVNRA